MKKIYFLNLLVLLLFFYSANSQCPQVYDGQGNPGYNPYWVSCSGNNYTLYLQSPDTIGSYTVDWGDGSAGDSGPDLIPPAFVAHTYAATVDTFIVTFTETASGCIVQGVVVMEEPVNASIQIPVGGVTQICAPGSVEFINSSTNVSQTTIFTWDFGDGSPLQVFDHTNAGQTVNHTYQNGTVNCETAVTLTADNYCTGTPTSAIFNPIQVYDVDQAQITASATLLCFPDNVVSFQNTTIKNCVPQGNTAQRYEYWNFGDYWGLGYDSIVNWQAFDPPARPGYTLAYPGTGTYTVMMIDSNMCGQDTAYVTIDIVAPPTAALSANPDTACAGEAVVFSNLSTGGANSFQWNFGDGSGWITTGAGNQTHSYNVAGDYTVSLIAQINGGTAACADTTTISVHILPSPFADFTLDDSTGCDSLWVNFTDNSASAVSWSWNFGNGNTDNSGTPPAQFYNPAGTYTVNLDVVAGNGCIDNHQRTVNIYQSPVAGFMPHNVCEDETASFTDLSTSSLGDPIISWSWDFGDGNGSNLQNPTNYYTDSGSYDILLTVATANCSSSDTVPVTVEPKPVAAFNTSIISGCTPLSVTFTNNSSLANSYFWDFGDGNTSTLSDPSHTFINTTANDITVTVMLIAETSFGCTDTAYQTITIFAKPSAGFTSDANPDCGPLEVNFTNTSTGANSSTWDFGDGSGSTLANPSHVYQNQTLFIEVFTAELMVESTNGCRDSITQSITVYPEPVFSFSSVPDSGCSPLPVTFPSVVGAVVYEWDFGDGTTATGPSPLHTFVNGTTNNMVYTVQLIATSPFGCQDTSYGNVIVHPNPSAAFTIDTSYGCQPLNVNITNLSTGASNFFWDFDDGSTSDTAVAAFNHTYTNLSSSPVVHNIALVTETDKGCRDTAFQQVEVYPVITADFFADTSGCSPLNVTFSNQSTGAVSFSWEFGDGSLTEVSANPSHTYTNNTTTDAVYTVSLIAESSFGCRDTAQKTILVHPSPLASFTATPVSQVYPLSTVAIDNTSNAGNWQYLWDFGDAEPASPLEEPGNHVYSTWGEYQIMLVVYSSYCSDTAYQQVIIEPPIPVAGFTGSGSGCKPLSVEFTDTSAYAHSWNWEFGDGNSSSEKDPKYTYHSPGIYTVKLTVTGPGGTDQEIKQDLVIVHEQAMAYFDRSPAKITIPNQPVIFYNFSSFASIYHWDFGDGSTSAEEFPEHYYSIEGTFDVQLIANNEFGCADTFLMENAVTAESRGDITFPNAFTPNPSGANGGAYDKNDISNMVFFPLSDGVVDYHLMIFNRWGELIFESFDINIGWDGYYRGVLCQQDVYVWKVKAKFITEDRVVKSGDVTLIR